MKQRICLLLVLIVALSTASIAETNGAASEFGLKGFAWGDPMEKVKEVEGTNIASSGIKTIQMFLTSSMKQWLLVIRCT